MTFRYCSFLFSFLFSITVFAQTPLGFTYTVGSPIVPGQPLEVEVHVEDFNQLSGVQLAFEWDSLVMEIDTVPFVTSDLPDFNNGTFTLPEQTFNKKKGILRLSWFTFGAAQSLADDHHLFTMRFNVVGEPCDMTSFTLSSGDPQLEIEVSNESGVNIGAVSATTPVEIPGTNCGDPPNPGTGVGLIFDDLTAESGQNVCLPFKVTDFSAVETMQGSVNWDPAVLNFTGVQAIALPNMSVGSNFNLMNVGNGTLNYSWIDQSGMNPAELPDNSTVFEICFDVIGANGSTSKVMASDNPVVTQLGSPDPSGQGSITLDHFVSAGCITVGGTPPPPTDFTLNVVDATATGSQICVDVTADNFTDITGMQYTFEWDETALCYSSVMNLNTTVGIFESSFFSAGADKLRFNWFNPAVSVPNGTLLYTICYDVKDGNCGETTTINIVDDLVPIEITSGTMAIDFVINSGNVSIECPMGINCTETVVQPSCNGGNNGSVTLIASGGQAPYSCLWDTGEFDDFGQSLMLTGQSARTVSATITDSNGETGTCSAVISQPSQISITGSTTATTCTSNGSINFNISGGTGPYTQEWSNNINPASAPAGTHTLLVRDNNNCTATMVFTVADGCPTGCDQIAILIFSAGCTCDGRIQVNCSTGAPLTSTPTSNPPLTWDASQQSFINACAGTYVITDSSNPNSSVTAQVNQTNISSPTINVNNIIPAICDGPGGRFNVDVTGGCAPYTITVGIQGGAKGPYDPNTSYIPEDYEVCVTDAANNTVMFSFNLPETSDPIGITVTDISPAPCGGSGQARVTITGGCDPVCEITGPNGTLSCNSGQLVSFPPGSYIVNVSDNTNSASQSFVIAEDGSSDPIVIDLNAEDALCNGMTGSASYTSSGGCGNISCSIDVGNTGNFVDCASIDFDNVPIGTHTITLVDENNQTTSETFTVGISDDAAMIIVDDIGCNFILVTATGTGNITYTWTLPGGGESNDEDLSDLTQDGNYTLNIIDDLGCTASTTINNYVVTCGESEDLSLESIGATSLFGAFNSPCHPANGDCEGEVQGVIAGGDSPYVLTLRDEMANVTTFDIDASGIFTIQGICPGSFTVSLDDASGNSFNSTSPLVVDGPDELIIIEDNIDCEDMDESNGSVSTIVSGGVDGYVYNWNPSAPDAGNTNENLSAGGYFLTVTDENGCTASIQLEVPLCGTNGDCYEALSLITPNNDGRNDIFVINCAAGIGNTLGIYDRWGRTVLDATNYQNDWSGTDLDGQELPEGAYFWVLRTDDNRIEKGTVTLLRN